MREEDENLIKEYMDGDELSFKILIDKYTSSIYNYVARFVGRDNASDLTQDVFIKVWKNIGKFDVKKASFKTWIFKIARNTVIDYLRKKKMVSFSDLDTEENSFGNSIEDTSLLLQDEVIIKTEDEDLLKKAIEDIPPHYKEILILYYEEDLTFKEIGELLGKPLNTVKSYHRRALLKLKEKLAPKL